MNFGKGDGIMKIETQGWGSSMVATKYIYERLTDLRDEVQNLNESRDAIKEFDLMLLELELNYLTDTGEKL